MVETLSELNSDLQTLLSAPPGLKLGVDIGSATNYVTYPDCKMLRLDIRPEVKPDILADATNLNFIPAGTFDIVHSSHVLEHFPRGAWKGVLAGWIRLLNQEGEIWFNLPNIMWAAERMAIDKVIDEHVLNVLYGGQDNEFDYHYNGLTPEIMEIELKKHRFELIHFTKVSYNMFLGAKRPA
jgi:ubiquinone/menaquinone biosynthesis C-methylase UbiE